MKNEIKIKEVKGILVKHSRVNSYAIIVVDDWSFNTQIIIDYIKNNEVYYDKLSSINSSIIDIRDTDWRFIDDKSITYTKTVVSYECKAKVCVDEETFEWGMCDKCKLRKKIIEKNIFEVSIINPGDPLTVY